MAAAKAAGTCDTKSDEAKPGVKPLKVTVGSKSCETAGCVATTYATLREWRWGTKHSMHDTPVSLRIDEFALPYVPIKTNNFYKNAYLRIAWKKPGECIVADGMLRFSSGAEASITFAYPVRGVHFTLKSGVGFQKPSYNVIVVGHNNTGSVETPHAGNFYGVAMACADHSLTRIVVTADQALQLHELHIIPAKASITVDT